MCLYVWVCLCVHLSHLGNMNTFSLVQLRPADLSSEPLLSRSLDGALVASVSPVMVSADSDTLGISACARGAKLSSTICRAL